MVFRVWCLVFGGGKIQSRYSALRTPHSALLLSRIPRPSFPTPHSALRILLLFCFTASSLRADQILHQDGRLLDGQFARISKTAEDPLRNPDPEAAMPIFLCDNELTRTMVPFRMLRGDTLQPQADTLEKIRIPQKVADGKSRVACVGPLLDVKPFDAFGRRTITISTSDGPANVIQGITTITPVWTKIEGLQAGSNIVWDMRVATSSIPRETLSAIMGRAAGKVAPLDKRLAVVRLMMQSERYRDAETELQAIAKEFPESPVPKQVLGTVRQLGATVLIREIELRKKAGQHQLAYALLQKFPSDDLPGTIQQQIRGMLEEYVALEKRRTDVIAQLNALLRDLSIGENREEWMAVIKEISGELSLFTLGRMAAYENLRGDETTLPEQKLALALSGWVLGADGALTNPKVAMSLWHTRNLIQTYLNTPQELKRAELLQQIQQQEANSQELLTRIIKWMKPAQPLPERASPNEALELSVPGEPNQPDYQYTALLPPEYDPHRAYPAIVCLHAQGMTPGQELDWWAGEATERGRLGQATRQGYIVIAPDYVDRTYQATPLEHDKVTKCLRDACRRFNVDSDRVFLSGHSMGGDAAWDIGLSHPDLWAGVIPINATALKDSVNHYWQNGAVLPMYFVGGELDCGVIQKNSVNWDRYFLHGYDLTLVEYLGRGHENFSDEIQRLFDWMNRKNREKDLRLFPKKFKVVTKRPTDNYFWSLEVREFNVPKIARGIELEQEIKGNTVFLRAPGQGKVSIWLSPEMVNFSSEIKVLLNGISLVKGRAVPPSAEVLLEDVRTRGERCHPFWAVIEN